MRLCTHDASHRRLAKDFERRIEASTAMLAIAIIQLLVRRLASA